MGNRVCDTASLDDGGDMRKSPKAGLEDIYVCAIRAPAERANMTGANGILHMRMLCLSSRSKCRGYLYGVCSLRRPHLIRNGSSKLQRTKPVVLAKRGRSLDM